MLYVARYRPIYRFGVKINLSFNYEKFTFKPVLDVVSVSTSEITIE